MTANRSISFLQPAQQTRANPVWDWLSVRGFTFCSRTADIGEPCLGVVVCAWHYFFQPHSRHGRTLFGIGCLFGALHFASRTSDTGEPCFGLAVCSGHYSLQPHSRHGRTLFWSDCLCGAFLFTAAQQTRANPANTAGYIQIKVFRETFFSEVSSAKTTAAGSHPAYVILRNSVPE
jgi:hypothetical protein